MRVQTTTNPEMFILARECRGLTQNELKERMGIAQSIISKIEQGFLTPAEDLISNFARHLNYPEKFFYRMGSRWPPTAPFHRKRQALSRKVQSQIEAAANIRNLQIRDLLDQVESETSLKNLDPDDYEHDGPTEIAKAIRRYWKIPRGPIKNLTSVMEQAGIIIVHVDFATSLLDGIAFLTEMPHPVIYINKNIPSDRLRLTLAHELGHIIMHNIPHPDMEDQAYLFAGEFLAPGDEIGPYLENLSLDMLARLKPYWKMAMGAIIMRAKHLKKLTPDEERRLWAKMSYHGYKQREPAQLDFPKEEPSLLHEILEYHLSDLGYSVDELCDLLTLHTDDFHSLWMPERREKLRIVR